MPKENQEQPIEEKQESYTYLYLDPRDWDPIGFTYRNHITLFYIPFYGGKGIDNRMYAHLEEARKLIDDNKSIEWIEQNYSNSDKIKRIIDILEDGLTPIIFKVLINATDQQAKEYEILLIDKIGRYDKCRGPLLNMTDGGEGGDCITFHPSYDEICEKRKKYKWYTNGKDEDTFKIGEEPKGWYRGRPSVKGENNPSGSRNKKWYNNGKIEDYFILSEQPNGWKLGKLPIKEITRKKISKKAKERFVDKRNHPSFGKPNLSSKDKEFYNNEIIEDRFFRGEQPDGWKKGRIYKQEKCFQYGKKWYNNGTFQSCFKENKQPAGWERGMLKKL